MLPLVDYCMKKRKAANEDYEFEKGPAEAYPEPYGLVFLPTRELTNQICEQGRKFASGNSLHCF